MNTFAGLCRLPKRSWRDWSIKGPERAVCKFDSSKGAEFEAGKLSLEDLRVYAIEKGESLAKSGRQEYLENIVNGFI